MERNAQSDMVNRILADLVRTSIITTLGREVNSKTKSNRRPKVILPLGDDLPSYLRGIHRLLTAKEIAASLHMHTETLYRRIKKDNIPAKKDGRLWKFDPSEVADWYEREFGRLDSGKSSDEEPQ